MKKYLDIVGVVLSILTGVGELVKSVEVAGPGTGVEKKNAVMQILGDMFSLLKGKSGVDVSWEEISGLVSKAIDTVVNLFNISKIFKKG